LRCELKKPGFEGAAMKECEGSERLTPGVLIGFAPALEELFGIHDAESMGSKCLEEGLFSKVLDDFVYEG